MAACVMGIFDRQQQIILKIDFYDVDPQMFDNLMSIINEKQKQSKMKKGKGQRAAPLEE